MKLVKLSLTSMLAVTMLFTSCQTTRPTTSGTGDTSTTTGNRTDTSTTGQEKTGMNKTTKGGIIGAGSGAVVGGIIGNRMGNTAAGAIIGAAVGGATGAVIGRRMDKQAEELQKSMENANVERVGEGIRVNFDSGILFAVNSAELSATAKKDIAKLAETLKKYDGTNIIIEGHTDNTGSRELNQGLSERRAQSVANYARTLGVEASRMQAKGYAFDQPIADNTTAEGRQQNRRVEVIIVANEELKKAAESGELK
ncbi:OmpA family protein [Pontibacter ramchanderi]|uniref:Outer membrane protein OmpA-like peptidoglycan-associated protein n=1 Tax=Pontibacter ramchanderi TaxID=1179743 RepID=A0A2N3U9Z8_9BACT|nr:OmpA family protein [Pontibacter ramchanderi]PKV63609.1 outer membrane protein OmpA-like peptidoglycan-associated protein [Pontibacter ramchanderi]